MAKSGDCWPVDWTGKTSALLAGAGPGCSRPRDSQSDRAALQQSNCCRGRYDSIAVRMSRAPASRHFYTRSPSRAFFTPPATLNCFSLFHWFDTIITHLFAWWLEIGLYALSKCKNIGFARNFEKYPLLALLLTINPTVKTTFINLYSQNTTPKLHLVSKFHLGLIFDDKRGWFFNRQIIIN